MQVSHPNAQPLTPEKAQELAQLKAIVEQALQNGKFSRDELDRIQQFILADGKVTYAEMETIRKTIREQLGEAALEYDWG